MAKRKINRNIDDCLFEIYELTNTTTGKKYIGATKNGMQRILGHFRALRNNNNKRCNPQLKKDYDLGHNFSFKFLNLIEGKKNASQLEIYYISEAKKEGEVYNISIGGIDSNKGYKQSDYAKKIASRVHSQRTGDKNSFYGKHHSEKTKKMISEKNKGRLKGIKKSEDTKRKMSDNNPNRKSISIDGVQYRALYVAAEHTNIDRKKLSKMASDPNIKNIFFIDNIK